MNVIVCIKQTFDTEAKITLNSNGRIDANGVNLIINPYDEYAIEEGIRLKEKFGGEVTVITMGSSRAQEALRTSLAMGADKAILVTDPSLEGADEWVTAQVLSKVIADLPYDLILSGRIAIDDGSGQVAVRVAENLNIPSATSVLKLEVGENSANVTREIDGGTENIEIPLPLLITAQKGLNEPRYPSVAGMMKAKKKELKVLSLADIGLNSSDLAALFTVDQYSLPKPRQAGVPLTGNSAQAVGALVHFLHKEIKVL
jgi:electron transfer flavoprotein beta subunit